MVFSRQTARFLEAVTLSGAKLAPVGDPEQLQPIEAGAAFRAIAERIGYAELETSLDGEMMPSTWSRCSWNATAHSRARIAWRILPHPSAHPS